jgi:glucokinase
MVNIDWRFSQTRLQKHLQLAGMIVVNDAAAIAWGIPDLTSVELRKAGGGDAAVRSPIAVIGPGSGLAVAALIPAEEDWTAVVGEGGHASISTITDRETAVADYVRSRSGHCSAEDLLSGPGLVNIFNALEQLEGRTTSSMSPAEVSTAADTGNPIASEAHSIFFSLLGTAAGNLALTVGASGGVFVSGDIVPKLIEKFLQSDFRERFESKGSYRGYMERIPTFAIVDPYPAFRGLRKLLGYR